jgi:hypothetical protein
MGLSCLVVQLHEGSVAQRIGCTGVKLHGDSVKRWFSFWWFSYRGSVAYGSVRRTPSAIN